MRVRLRFAKLGKVRFVGHRDVARIWERALRRAQLPVAYSQGFSPRPKLSFGLALSTGYESVAEYLDVELAVPDDDQPPLDVATLPLRLSSVLPSGLDVTAASMLAPGAESLQQAVTSCTWRIEVGGVDGERVHQLVERARTADALVMARQRKAKVVTDDLRPAVLSVTVLGPTPGGTELEAELAVQPRSVRPAELVAALGDVELHEGRVCRLHQWILREGAHEEPLLASTALEDAPRPHAEVRAS